jgi:threonine synthase
MLYVSTRGGMTPRPFTEILMEGLAPDGGLVVPENYPRLSIEELAALRSLDYRTLAFEILRRFLTDIPENDLRAIVDTTYTAEAFGSDDITPVSALADNMWLLQTSNGPSLAFKDVAMQLLGNLFPYVLAKTGDELNILGATSGDTGGAAIYAMRGKPRIRVFMLSPYQRTSKFQAAQMFSVLDPNIFNIAIQGVFDDCQDIVKVVGEDAPFKARHRIGTVNSINWARVVAQVVYYFKAYFAVTDSTTEQVAFSVPSGNFGNVFAGHVARMMGLPIERLIVATNENDVLDEFFRTGAYRPRPSSAVHATSSPSMDISKASNFERFIFDLTNRDPERTRELYDQVRNGGFDLNGTDERRAMGDYNIVSGVSTHTNRLATIQMIHQRCGRVIDTHTADGVKVAYDYQPTLPPGTKIVCLETALPIKFGETIVEALGFEPERPDTVVGLEDRAQRVEVLPNDSSAVMAYIASRTS